MDVSNITGGIVSHTRKRLIVALSVVSNEVVSKMSMADWLVGLIALGFIVLKATDGKLHHIPNPEFHRWYLCPQEGQLTKPVGPKRTRNINIKMSESDKDMVVFWGTQSGTAKVLAKSLAREATARYNVKSMAADIDDYDQSHLADFPRSRIAVFILATYGEGDPPDNTLDFCSVLGQFRCQEQGEKILEKLRYAAFGLGNKNYAEYNKIVDSVNESLILLGAQQLVPVGKGDESTGSTERSFTEWKTTFFKFLEKDMNVTPNETLKYIPSVSITTLANTRPTLVYRGEPNKKHLMGHLTTAAVTQDNPYTSPIVTSRHLFDSRDRHCLHMEFSIDGFPSQALKYETGDHLAVWPSNPTVEVDRLARVLGLEIGGKEEVIEITSLAGEQSPIPTPTTRQVAMRYYLEICGSPTRDTLSLLAQFAPDYKAAKELIQLVSSHEAFKSGITDKYLTLAQVLERINNTPGAWSKIPFTFILEYLPRLRPRYYSISSSSVLSPKQPSITAIVTCHDIAETPFLGVASNYLLSAHEKSTNYELMGPRDVLKGWKIYIHLRKSKFRLPSRVETPIIMIATGTGIAPFRGFITERAQQFSMNGTKMVLFFGCRNDKEYLYKQELQSLEKQLNGRLQIITAFSRQGKDKCYVQQRIVEHADIVRDTILQGSGNVYICGAARMARDVEGAIIEVLKESKGEGTEKFVKETMKKNRRLQEDVW